MLFFLILRNHEKKIIIAISILSVGCKAEDTFTEVGEIININNKNGVDVNGAYYKVSSKFWTKKFELQ